MTSIRREIARPAMTRTDADLRVPAGNHFEKLRGLLSGWHSIRVNEQWRLVFRWHGDKGEASDVYLDNHSYR
jgi:proteic killer suppression protein